jgi:hypothetical protein
MVLINQLPQESRTLTAVRDALTPDERARLTAEAIDVGHGRWSRTDMLLAAQVDATRQQTWALAQWKRGERPPAPEPMPRPGVEQKRAKPKSLDELRERMSPKAWARAEALRKGLPLPD